MNEASTNQNVVSNLNIGITRNDISWNIIGKQFKDPVTAAEAIDLCGANYQVGKQPLLAVTPSLLNAIANNEFICGSDLKQYLLRDQMATMRLDHNVPLGIVSNSYQVVQNIHAFDFIDIMTTGRLGSETPTIECAGVLGYGERIFITAKFPEPIRVNNSSNDLIDMYIVITTTHDGTGSVTCMITPVRVYCANTLNIALNGDNKGKITWRHTGDVLSKIDMTNASNLKRAYEALHLYDVYKKDFQSKLIALQNKQISDKAAESIFAHALLKKESLAVYEATGRYDHPDIPKNEQIKLIGALYSLYGGVGQLDLDFNTGLWLINGITTYFQNDKSFRTEESKMRSIMEGEAYKALQYITDQVMSA